MLSQLPGVPPGTEASTKCKENERIQTFLSFWLSDAENRYVNSKREFLAVIRCLTEVKWLVVGSPFPMVIYSDHSALRDVFAKGDRKKRRIDGWMDRFGEFEFRLAYRSYRDPREEVTTFPSNSELQSQFSRRR